MTRLFPGEGRGPGALQGLTSNMLLRLPPAWTPAFAGELERP